MKANHDVQPVLMEQISIGYLVRWNLEEITVDGETRWQWDEAISPTRTYDDVVSALIHAKYTLDQEIATINNHLVGQDEDEWLEYQAWRTWAKDYARNTLNLQ